MHPSHFGLLLRVLCAPTFVRSVLSVWFFFRPSTVDCRPPARPCQHRNPIPKHANMSISLPLVRRLSEAGFRLTAAAASPGVER